MTRNLCQIHQAAIKGTEDLTEDWPRWMFTESLRRNIFLVHIINVLAAKAYQLNEDFFEPLNNDLILHMPLPAPEAAWRATTEQEWRIALMASTRHSSFSRLGLADDIGKRRPPDTLHRWLSSDQKADLNNRAPVPLLTRVILACARIQMELGKG